MRQRPHQDAILAICHKTYILLNFRKFYPTRPERAEAPSPGRALKKVPNFKLHSLFLNFNSCPRSISSFKSGILFWTGI